MARSKSSKRWLQEHFSDPYVKQSQQAGYRSRAAYKLLALQDKDKLIKPGMVVVDLGAAPGGWSQIAAELVGASGHVMALDILPMAELPGVEFIQGDFTEDAVLATLTERLVGKTIDLVLSDMAPNLSGEKAVDQPRAMLLAELALDAARLLLTDNGAFVTKVFQGEGFDAFLLAVKAGFSKVVVRKPAASRARSREVYIVARGFKGRS